MKKLLLILILIGLLTSCSKKRTYYCVQIHYTSMSFDTTYFNITMNQNDYNNFINSSNTQDKCNFLFTKCY